MSVRFLVRIVAVAIGMLLGNSLWAFWTRLCNEACAPARTTLMVLLSAALPLSLVLVAFEFTNLKAAPHGKHVRVALLAALSIAAIAVSAV